MILRGTTSCTQLSTGSSGNSVHTPPPPLCRCPRRTEALAANPLLLRLPLTLVATYRAAAAAQPAVKACTLACGSKLVMSAAAAADGCCWCSDRQLRMANRLKC